MTLAAADVLGVTDLIHTGQATGFRIASGCNVAFDLILACAFGLSGAAFLSPMGDRSRRLEISATLAAAGLCVGLIAAAIATATSIHHNYPNGYVTSQCLVVAARFATAFAALAASRGFSSTAGSDPDVMKRESWLGWAAGGLAASYGLAALAEAFINQYLSDAGLTSSYTTGADVAIFGYAVALLAGAIAAFGFRGARRRQREGIKVWLSSRDGMLGLATGTFAVAFLLIGIGFFIEATAGSENGFSSTRLTILWLLVVFALGDTVAGACAAFGFSRSAMCKEELPAGRSFGGNVQPETGESEAERRQA